MQNYINKSVEFACKKWQLSALKPLAQSLFTDNYVTIAYSMQYECEVVLKVCMPNANAQRKALQCIAGSVCVKLLDYDENHGVLLMEYIQPGTSLKTFFPERDIQALEITADIIKKLHTRTLTESDFKEFQTADQWLSILITFESKKIPAALLHKAKKLSEKLLKTQGKRYVLHGDLHHENILQSDHKWVVIDPKGFIGELEYEVGIFIMNPIPELLQQPNVCDILISRINRFCEIFGFDKQRLMDWCFVQGVLGACWQEEDNPADPNVGYFTAYAKLIEELVDKI